MDKGTIYTLALAHLGLPAYKAGTPASAAIEAVAQQCLYLALDYQTWTFATKLHRFTIGDDGQAPLPSDCLRLVRCTLPKYELLSGTIYAPDANRGTYALTYVSCEMVENMALPDNQPAFCEGVSLLIAAKIAPQLTSNPDLSTALEQKAYTLLSHAKHKDVCSHNSNDQRPSNHQLLEPTATNHHGLLY